jgi:hypothetical protein
VLAQGSFRVHDLEREVGLLADEEQALQQKVAELAAPARLAQQARSLGMVPMTTPAFLRASDGKVLGRPSAAVGAVPQWAAPVVRPQPAPAPAPVPTVKPSQTAGGKAGDKPGTTADARSRDKPRDKPGTTADSSGDGGGR